MRKGAIALSVVVLFGAACGGDDDDSEGSLIDYCVEKAEEFGKQAGFEGKPEDLRAECQESYDKGDFENKAEVDAWIKVAQKFMEDLQEGDESDSSDETDKSAETDEPDEPDVSGY